MKKGLFLLNCKVPKQFKVILTKLTKLDSSWQAQSSKKQLIITQRDQKASYISPTFVSMKLRCDAIAEMRAIYIPQGFHRQRESALFPSTC